MAVLCVANKKLLQSMRAYVELGEYLRAIGVKDPWIVLRREWMKECTETFATCERAMQRIRNKAVCGEYEMKKGENKKLLLQSAIERAKKEPLC